jgi:hypothetical protein
MARFYQNHAADEEGRRTGAGWRRTSKKIDSELGRRVSSSTVLPFGCIRRVGSCGEPATG